MNKKVFSKLLNRRLGSHKYDFGHVLIIGGSPGMVGAPYLAGRAALRTGAGLVTIASSQAVIDKLERRVDELMTLTIPEDPAKAILTIGSYLQDRKVSVIVIGPGLRANLSSLVTKLLKSSTLPLIIDGGGLSSLQKQLSLLKTKNHGDLILTPHMGEFQRFFDHPLPKNHTRLKQASKQFALDHNLYLVLKGNPTYVASPSKRIYTNTTGGPGLATAGTGDVLSGVIAGMISQGIEPGVAAEAGVYLHGLAGDIATAQKTEPGVIASDVIESIPTALKHIKES